MAAPSARAAGSASGSTGAPPPPTPLSVVAARARPVTAAADRVLAVTPPLGALLPDGGVRRGSTVTVGRGTGVGATSLALALAAGASAAGGWCAAVALADLGLVAAAGLGVALERLALVPDPGAQWPVVTAALLESVDVVVVRPPGRVRDGDARRLTARARERGAVLVVLGPVGARAGAWPEAADLHLAVTDVTWQGLEQGHGHLVGRVAEVAVTGRRGAVRERRGRLLLPGATGAVEAAPGAPPVAAPVTEGAAAVTARSPRAAAVLAAATAARDARATGAAQAAGAACAARAALRTG
ncbi:MAG TPA: hypothetical protein VFP61_06900 [Acidimicrobiales bacterium]|nr:hypothetical protein [Acidimicrobiales bacterium]